MDSGKTNDGVRTPLFSIEDAAKAAWLAPVIIVGMSVIVRPSIPAHSVTSIAYGAIICLLTLVGLCAAIWAVFVALGWGPRKYLVPATIGLALNSFLVWVIVGSMYVVYQMKAKAERESASSTVQQTSAEEASLVGDRYAPQLAR